jgi:hypothetical protein
VTKKGAIGPIFREICPLKNDPKSGAINGTITGIMLIRVKQHALFLSIGLICEAERYSNRQKSLFYCICAR